jgi:hypothetical protein
MTPPGWGSTLSTQAPRQKARGVDTRASSGWARIGKHVGQRNLAVTANTYSHVLVDEHELDYATLLVRA